MAVADPHPMFVPGQRWISTAEPELGLGCVLRVERRIVELLFARADVMHRYATQSAPLVRARFGAGQRVAVGGEQRLVDWVEERDRLLVYHGAGREWPEGALDDEQAISQADQRLLSGRVDAPDDFDLRREAWRWRAAARQSPAFGLNGARIELLPHQLRVVQAATARMPPRVLLADEVGLGKTIEAGMIIARMLASGSARRVLVLLPDSLVNQWFVELLRRFNLAFAIFDDSRAQAIEAAGDGRNPFEDEQCVMASVNFVAGDARRAQQVLAAGWDLLVVDEAHHLEWTPQGSSVTYGLVEALAATTPALVLLTATPEQLGRSGHFARLRLLDSARYHDLDAYIAESRAYVELSPVAAALHAGAHLSGEQLALLRGRYADDAALQALLAQTQAGSSHNHALLEALIDRHGTGRVMFRNRRDQVGGFPERHLYLEALDGAAADETRRQALLAEFRSDVATPPTPLEFDYAADPRLPWLLGLLAAHPHDKFLLVCRGQAKVEELERVLRPSGIKLARFHEGLGLLPRDRNAAWFAQADGARLMLASEIGSEGRNFQFAHRLVLWDLPLDPDLLEQRIGRLDRIGQQHPVAIHLAVLHGSAQHVLARWFDAGVDAFARSPADARALLRRFREPLLRLCADDARGLDQVDEEFEALLAETRAEHQRLSARIHAGRDRLLELAASRAGGETLRQALAHADTDPARDEFALRLLERFGVQVDDLGGAIFRLDPATLSTDALVGFESGEQSITFAREVALKRDDVRLLRLDHPLLQGALELLLSTEPGNAAFMLDAAMPARQAVLQAVFVLECVAPARLDVERFVPHTPLSVNIDARGRERPQFAPSPAALQRALEQPLDAERCRRLLLRLVPPMLDAAQAAAQAHARQRIDAALAAADQHCGEELDRLDALMAINRSVRRAELEALEAERDALRKALPTSRVRLDALRLVVSADLVS